MAKQHNNQFSREKFIKVLQSTILINNLSYVKVAKSDDKL